MPDLNGTKTHENLNERRAAAQIMHSYLQHVHNESVELVVD